MTDRRPSDHDAPETESYHYRQNAYFGVAVLGVIAVVGMILVVYFAEHGNPISGPYRELPLLMEHEEWARDNAAQQAPDHSTQHGAMGVVKWRAHVLEGPHGGNP